MRGPVTFATSEPNTDVLGDPEVANNVVRLISSIDFESIIQTKIGFGKLSWTKPLGVAFYLAFIIPKEEARGNYELHAIASVFPMEYLSIASEHENTILALTSHAMNELLEWVKRIFQTENDDTLNSIKGKVTETLRILKKQIAQELIRS